jgi:hypothetical protein
MSKSPLQALTQVFLPNHTKLKGAATLISAIERKEKVHFEPVWKQAYVAHDPKLYATTRKTVNEPIETYRVGVIDLPTPKDMGDSHLVAWVVKQGDPAFMRYFTLEHDYVLKTSSNRTLVCERQGQQHTKHFEGPAMTGDFAKDSVAFVDAFMELLIPTKVARK